MNVDIKCVGPSVNGNTAVTVNGERIKGISKVEVLLEAGKQARAIIYLTPRTVDLTDIDSEYVETAAVGRAA
jgi:uncharacterized HAD superfamily protein